MSKNSKDENEGKSQRVMKKEKQRRHSDRQYNLTVKGTENYQNYPIFKIFCEFVHATHATKEFTSIYIFDSVWYCFTVRRSTIKSDHDLLLKNQHFSVK